MTSEALISDHPVEPAMRAQILDCLHRLEADHDVKVLFACESGSRGWGFASPDSDYDVRFIYVNRLAWYLTVEAGRDVIEQPISGDLDVNGWDLRKTLQLLRQSNPTLLEWLRSPIVYREDAATAGRLRLDALAHFRGEEVRYKKYLYVLRPLLAARWIRAGRGVPPMRFAALAEATLDDRALPDEINRLLEVKMRAGEAATSPRWQGLHEFIEAELAAAASHVVAEATQPDAAALDGFLAETVLKNELDRDTRNERHEHD